MRKQAGYRIAFSKVDAYIYLREKGRRVRSFKYKEGWVVERYKEKFGREPAQGGSGPQHFLFSYGELFEWFDIPLDVQVPDEIRHLVLFDRLPALSDV